MVVQGSDNAEGVAHLKYCWEEIRMNSVTFRIGTVVCLCIKRAIPLLCLSLAWLLAAVPAFSQGNTGRILGTVSDQNGGNVVGAAVTITDVQRGISRSLITGEGGEYVAGDLLPGTYKVRVEVKGFKIFERQNILLEVGKDVRIDVVLQPGSVSETITITEEVPMVDTTSTTLGGTISNEIINDLPLNGRNYQNLLTLRPGTSIYPGGGPWTQSTNGIRPEDTSYIVDGITNDEAFMGFSVTNAAAVLGDAATVIPIDAIQEFNTQVNPKAEFGWKPGAVTSVGLKSGTNQIHGSAYAFGRGDSFDARNYFDPVGTPKTPLELEQFGGTAGGHIVRDKLFYFGAFEARRYTVGNSLPGKVPTTASVGDPTISIPDAIAAIGGPSNVNPLSSYLLGFYTPNASGGKFVSLNFPNEDSSKNALGKVDYHINDHNALSGSYFFGNDTIIGMDFFELLSQFRTKVHSRAQDVSGHWAWTPSSSLANEFRGGFTHYVLQILPSDISFPYKINTGISNPLLKGIPNINIPGLTELGAFHNFPKIVGPDKVYDFIDQLSYLRGKHAFKFGGELRRDLVHQGTFRAGRGRIHFANLEAFLAGTPGNTTFLAGDPTRNLSQWLYAGYLQDDWRITPRVTLNLGLRYEYQGVPTEDRNLLGNFEPRVGLEQVGKNISSVYNGDHRNFSPRLGVAWDVTGKGTTVVRAGGSIIYQLLSMSTFLSQQYTQNTVTLGVGTVPTGATIITCPAPVGNTCPVTPVTTPGVGNILATGITIPGSSLTWLNQSTAIYPASVTGLVQCGDGVGTDPGPCDTFAMQRNFRTPYVENWTLGVQHAFSGKLSMDLSYVGNHAAKLSGVMDLNQPSPGGARPLATQFPYLGFINYLSNLYGSTYHGLQATLTSRNFHGLDFLAGYTYSHALDYDSSNWVAFLPKDSTHPGLERGSSDFDIRHRFTLSVTYTLPEKKTWGQFLEGWQVNTIITLQSGQPWQVNDQVNDFSHTGELADRWDFFGNPSDFHSDGPKGIPFCTSPPNGPTSAITPTNSPSCSQTDAFGNSVPFSAAQTTTTWNACLAKARDTTNGGTLQTGGCFVQGNSLLVPPAPGTFGNMGRNIFRDTGFHNADLSISKSFKFGERFRAQFRAEMFNVFNHPSFANEWGGASTYGPGGVSDPATGGGSFGCGCATPDSASVNPVLGSGSNRAIQLGLKFLF
jgi:carboxypeptidase family protein/TonB-dependent receptor-like protein